MSYQVVVTAAAKQNLRSAYLWAAERAPQTAAAAFATTLGRLIALAESRSILAPFSCPIVVTIDWAIDAVWGALLK